MGEFLWKINKGIVFATILFAVFGMLLTGNFSISMFVIITSLIILVVAFIYGKNKGIVGYIYIYYALLVGPINLLISVISPETLKVNNINKYYDIWVLSENNILITYSLLLIIFYVISMFTIILLSSLRKKSVMNIRMPKILSIKHPIITAIFISIMQYFVRSKFGLSIPGQVPTIPFAGVIVYIFEAANYYILFLILNKNVSRDRKMTHRNLFSCIMGMFFTQLSSVLIGQRGPIVYSFLLTLIYIMVIQFDIMDIKNFKAVKRQTKRTIVITGLVVVIVVGLTNQIRIGEFTTIGFIVRRITGLYDGSIFLHYMNAPFENPPKSIIDFFVTLITGSGMIPNKYYTHYVLGYPLTAAHSNAAPVFITSLYYGGVIGLIVITIYLAIIMSFIQNVLQKSIKGYRGTNNIKYSAGIFCSIHALLIVLGSNIIDGNITAWKMYIVPIICYYLIRMTRIKNINIT